MVNKEFPELINKKYFDGKLSSLQMAYLENMDAKNSEAISFSEGMFENMKRIGMSAEDTAELLIWEIASILPKILPGAWGGTVPPITFTNRHVLVEEYMEKNHWSPLVSGNTVIDMGCGFPPYTAVDLAQRFPKAHITGADPSFGKYTVTDSQGNYACILEDGSLKYLQPADISSLQWNEVFDDLDTTKKRFISLFLDLEKHLSRKEDANTYEEYQNNGNSIVRNPLRKFAGHNLSFVQKGIGDDGFPNDLDMIRCMNVLLYFDPAFRENALLWAGRHLREGGIFICGLNYAQSVNCRFSVYQKENGVMYFREFAFSIENLRPMEMVSYYSFRKDDFEQDQLMKHVALIRRNDTFMQRFNVRFDELMHQNDICNRKDDGYLGFIDTSLPLGQLQLNMQQTGRQLSKECAQEACSVLQSLGKKAWVNEIGFISVGEPD